MWAKVSFDIFYFQLEVLTFLAYSRPPPIIKLASYFAGSIGNGEIHVDDGR